VGTLTMVHEFKTPEPIAAVIDLTMGDVRVFAGDRQDTVVELAASDPGKREDVAAAEQARVQYADGRLRVKAAQRWRSYSPFSGGGSVDVQAWLPAGSQLTGDAALAAFRCIGPLGECRIKTSLGDVELERTASVAARTGGGDVSVGRASGHTELSTGTGEVRVGRVDGSAVLKNSNGATLVGEITGDLRINAANGDIVIDRCDASLAAKTAAGDIRVGAVGRGPIVVESAFGAVEIAIPDGIAAWLDLSTGYGRLHNMLEASGPPAPGQDAVEVRARSGYGDITIRRSYADLKGER
jgi:hypothetical protein